MAYTFARRQALAREKGFASYAEQRKLRSQAAGLLETKGTSRRDIEQRDRVAQLMKGYHRGDMTRDQIKQALKTKGKRMNQKQLYRVLKHISPSRRRPT